MAYLTQFEIPAKVTAGLRIFDSYDWHQRVWECFPGRDGIQRDFLTRIDKTDDGFRLLVVSPAKPVRPDWCQPNSWRGTKLIPKDYFSHRRYRFQLCANPTKKVTVEKPEGGFAKNGRRVPLRSRDELVAWIKRKGEQGGFQIEEKSLRTLRQGTEYFTRKELRGLHNAVEFQGILEVTDAQKFRESFEKGIGSAKAFGFGLLVLAPLFDREKEGEG
jgi:CRISPR system Cascade subunit CasE